MKRSIVVTWSLFAVGMACSSEQGGSPSQDRAGGTTSSGNATSGATSSGNTTSGNTTSGNTTSGGQGGSGGAGTGGSAGGAVGTGSSAGGAGGTSGGGGAVVGTGGAGGAVVGTGGTGGKGGSGNGGAPNKDAGAAGGGVGGSGGAPPSRDGGPPTGIAARDVQLTLVEANQSTSVALLKSGAVVPVPMRNAALIEGRPTLVRAHVDVGAAWMPRNILGVLTLVYGDGTKRLVTETKNVTADSNADQLASTFNFLLTAAEVKPGMSITVELQETMQPATPEPAQPPRFPADGTPADLGIKGGLMELRVAIFPAITSGGFPQSTDQRRQVLLNQLYDIYPVQKVTIDWRDPIAFTDETNKAASLALMRDTCNAEKPSARLIYHMVVRGVDTKFTFAGTSGGSNSSPTSPCRAVSITVAGGATAYIDGNVNTTAHELGHNHGQSHIACGGAAGPDPSFPYQPPNFPEGFLGAQGYSITENALKPTSQFKELMGYCRPRWVSDWMWNKFEAKVRTMSTWPVTLEAGPVGHSLHGYVDSDGHANWAVVPGQLTEPGDQVSSSRHAKISNAGASKTLPISVVPLSDPDVFEVVATLPDGPLPTKATVIVDGAQHVIDFASIKKF